MFGKTKQKSELRFDVVNKDWVVVAEGRGKRPEDFKKKKQEEVVDNMPCAFCDYFCSEKFRDKNFAVVPNKFPAFFLQKNKETKSENALFQKIPSNGFHEVVVFNDHSKQLWDFSFNEWEELLGIYQQRYIDLSKEDFVNYVSVFHNHGKMAGASLIHPHSQIMGIPFFDKNISSPLNSSKEFFKEKSQCLFCAINRAEKSAKTRIIFENSNFLAMCPFASKVNFEIVISPKNHLPYFEKISEQEKSDLAQIFQIVLAKINKGLGSPDYNFYLKTSPCDDREYPFFHWHFTIMPRISVWAGFELGTGIEIITMPPEKAADYLKKIKI
ncbi:MAG: galactose-1-phosphate uridylyltransferase [Candidatus Pacebacteria bacterium]|nr:galactose-1-phosphate uridylyltransferase [Candidatus Paceibacterota bacterium]